VENVARRIDDDLLRPGARLPSVRSFARSQGVSAFTVSNAYDRLVAMGYLMARPGDGFYVVNRAKSVQVPAAVAHARNAPRDSDELRSTRNLLEQSRETLSPAAGWLPAEWLDEARLRRALRAAIGSAGATLVGYGPTKGYAPLREVLCRRLSEYGTFVDAGQILTTAGATHAIDLLIRLLVRPGDAVLVDDPGSFILFKALECAGAKVVGVPWGREGPDVEALQKLSVEHRPKTFFTNTLLHNPTGASLSQRMAYRVLQLADEFDLTVIEDDCYADLVDRETPRLVTLDGLHRVVYVGSFSKTISANLRVGFIAAKADLAEALCTLKVATGLTTSEAVERTIYQFLTMCGHRQSTRRLQGCLRDATMRVSRVMEEEGFELDRSVIGGMFLWARLPWFDDSEELARRCLREGIVLAPGRLFRANREKSPWLRFNVASLQNAKVLDAILRCAKAP